jgi:hypothetical protein
MIIENTWKTLIEKSAYIYVSINQQAIINTSDDKQKTLLHFVKFMFSI